MSTIKNVQTIKTKTGTTAMTIDAAGVVKQPTKPMFRVVRSADQSIANDTATVVQLDDKTTTGFFDIGGYFNTSTYRYTPLVTGYYSVTASGLLESAHYMWTSIRRNGTEEFSSRDAATSGAVFPTSIASGILYMNGSTDYLDVTVYHNAGSSKNIRGLDSMRGATYFCGFLIG